MEQFYNSILFTNFTKSLVNQYFSIMAGKGGARPGSGRKPLAEELKTADLARKALIDKFGSLNEALIALLKMNEPVLTKFVFEHAFGKPQDKIEHSGEVSQNIVGMIIK